MFCHASVQAFKRRCQCTGACSLSPSVGGTVKGWQILRAVQSQLGLGWCSMTSLHSTAALLRAVALLWKTTKMPVHPTCNTVQNCCTMYMNERAGVSIVSFKCHQAIPCPLHFSGTEPPPATSTP